MADIFVSYSRADKARVAPLVAALEAEGWSVWWDPEISPGQDFDSLIAGALEAAKAVIVVWTPASVASRWVRGEARIGAERGILVPARFERAELPIDVRAIHTTDLDGWMQNRECAEFQELARAVGALIPRPNRASGGASPAASGREQRAHKVSICVLPFSNMSGDAEQEYFSDGISEDVITDLSKVSALSVVSRNTAFGYKGKSVDIKQVARQLKVSHVLEGSVRKSGNRVRITAQLIEAASDNHVWAERYDRDLSDIFALQDEISEAIVKALKLKLMPEEKKAIGERGTLNAEAYNLYVMARQYSVTGSLGDARRSEAVIRLCQRAIELDPNYARALALMANAQGVLRFHHGRGGDAGLAAAEQALTLDPNLAEAHAAKGRALTIDARRDEARAEVETALRLDPESYEVNVAAGAWNYTMRQLQEAARYFDKAAALMETDYWASGMAMACYESLRDGESVRRVALRTLARTEKIVAQEPDNGSAAGFFVGALAALGEVERAREAAKRAALLDPDNQNMHYNLACSLIAVMNEHAAGLDVLERMFKTITRDALNWAKVDSDFDAVREHPRFKTMMAAAEARLAASSNEIKDGRA
jgi:TolB-like protein/Flp pilus assembly protein TadD